jgi:hypothetical protein
MHMLCMRCQVCATLAVVAYTVMAVTGVSGPAAIVLGGGLALSSTAVAMQVPRCGPTWCCNFAQEAVMSMLAWRVLPAHGPG